MSPDNRTIGIVGTGLIGTSLGMALRSKGVTVYLRDADGSALRSAVALGAGVPWEDQVVSHAVIAVPPDLVAVELDRVLRLDLAATLSDVCSVKTKPLREIEALNLDLTRICLAHPIAGRERGGATSAQADLFADRPWVLCPTPESSAQVRLDARWVAETVGGAAVEMDPREHDRLLARLSHVPQLVSSATAAAIAGLAHDQAAIAGQGVRDVIRLAGSDPVLWGQIIAANAPAVAAALRPVIAMLTEVAEACESDTEQPDGDRVDELVRGLVAQGRLGRGALPLKPGAAPAPWTVVDIVVPDKPGELARLFVAVGAGGINVEDVTMEHGIAQPAGVVHLSVIPESVSRLVDIAQSEGWHCTPRKDDSSI